MVIVRSLSTVLIILLVMAGELPAQKTISLTLENALEMALQNNHLLNVKKLQIEEKRQKVFEDKARFLPVITVGAFYQYNTSLPGLTLTKGQFGELPLGTLIIPLPNVDEVIRMGNHNIYNGGVTLYQPVTQLGKINAGLEVSRADMQITKAEETKAERQIRQSVEKLFYGLLITEKQTEEAEFRVEMSKSKLKDAESALGAGKTTDISTYGLYASVADEEQNLLKLRIQYDDYASDMKQLTGIDPVMELTPEPISTENFVTPLAAVDSSLFLAAANNSDIKIASLYSQKADFSIKASQYSYLPDIGLLGGYSYQKGSVIYPKNNAFLGASLKWNLQDMLFNHTIQRQRIFAKKQAEENLANTREQVDKDILKSYRRLRQSEELIAVAARAVKFRKEALRIQTDRHNSGMNLEADVLEAKAALAKSEADYYSAQMNYKIALSELKALTGNY